MSQFFSAVFTIAIILSGFFTMPANMPVKQVTNGSYAKQALHANHSFLDEEPIVMRSRVKSSGGIALSGVSVSLTLSGESEPAFSGITNELGECEFDSVPVGNYSLDLSKSGYVPVQAALALTENTTRTDTLELQH